MYWAAFIIGLSGSLHCAGMCGPLVMALSSRQGSHFSLFSLLHHSGRFLSYIFIGLLVGISGEFLSLLQYQNLITFILGGLLILWALSNFIPFLSKWNSRLSIKISSLLSGISKKSGSKYMGILSGGIMHGMIPCGLVYLAAISALYYSSIQASMIHMFIFGLGTLPVLLFTAYTGNKLFNAFRIQRALPFIVFLAGIMMILRGAELGIPIISPVIADPSSVEICE